MALAGPGEGAPDPELEALPEPRRPGRRLTLAALVITASAALLMAFSLLGEVRYALRGGSPHELGNLVAFDSTTVEKNSYVHGEALLSTTGAIRYGRPMETDTYRLAPVSGNDRLWVQVRVPAGLEGPRFVPPTSFVGRLVPVSDAGLRYAGLPEAVANASANRMPEQAFLLVDGEAPRTTRWAIGLMALFVGFAGFNLFGLYRLVRPIRDA
jgi:hypothetical protein